jgi:hypothetical protein
MTAGLKLNLLILKLRLFDDFGAETQAVEDFEPET